MIKKRDKGKQEVMYTCMGCDYFYLPKQLSHLQELKAIYLYFVLPSGAPLEHQFLQASHCQPNLRAKACSWYTRHSPSSLCLPLYKAC
jgi:hypothetical protein